MQALLSSSNPDIQWEFPLATGQLRASQAQAVYNTLSHFSAAVPAMGDLSPAATAVTVSSGLSTFLATFLGTRAAIETVLLLLMVSLIVTGAAVIGVAARMVAVRRSGELAVVRARGGSVRQVAVLMLRGAAAVALPAAVAGAALALAAESRDASSRPGLGPGRPGPGDRAGGAAADGRVAAPQTGPGQQPRPGDHDGDDGIPARLAAPLGGRGDRVRGRRGGPHRRARPGRARRPAADLLVAATPVLVAIPVVVVVLRLYPLVISGLAPAVRPCARRYRLRRAGPGVPDLADRGLAGVRARPGAQCGRVRRHGPGRRGPGRGGRVLAGHRGGHGCQHGDRRRARHRQPPGDGRRAESDHRGPGRAAVGHGLADIAGPRPAGRH